MEKKIKQKNPTLHRYLFTVTTFSKLLAMTLFIALPFIGFYLGMRYKEKITIITPIISVVQKITTPTPISASIDILNWKTYTNIISSATVKYPPSWTVKESHELSNRVVDNLKEINTAIISGKEGEIEIQWGPMGFGGLCDTQYKTFNIKNGIQNICIAEYKGNKYWGFIGNGAKDDRITEAKAIAYPPLNVNSQLIEKILSTLELTK